MTITNRQRHPYDRDLNDLVLDTMNYRYELRESKFYNHQGVPVEAIEFTVETDLRHPDVFAVQVIDIHGAEFSYFSYHIAAWPQPVRRLYQAHVKSLRLELGKY